jgi:hypothetical protein
MTVRSREGAFSVWVETRSPAVHPGKGVLGAAHQAACWWAMMYHSCRPRILPFVDFLEDLWI